MSQLASTAAFVPLETKRLKLNIPTLMTVAVLYSVVFGAHPFAARVATTDLTTEAIPLYYWAFFLLTNLLVGYVFVKTFSSASLRLFSGLLYVLLGWALFSLLWSNQPTLGFSRYIQLMIVTVSALTIVQSLGPERTLDILAKFLFFTILVDWMSVAFIQQAVHLYDENDANLIGSWRGLHLHKNIAAPLMVIACLLFLSRFAAKRRLIDVLGFVLAAAFLWGTNSRTSIGFFTIAFSVLIILQFKQKNSPLFGIASAMLFLLASAIGSILLYANYDVIKTTLSNPLLFSGRGGLWGIIMILSSGNDFMGFGYGSFWRVGLEGISYDYANGWHASSFNGHNGYLDILITLGWIGFWLAIATFVIEPVIYFLIRGENSNHAKKVAFAIIVFVLLHNVLESTLLMWNADTYFIWLLAACILRYPAPKDVA